MGEKNSTGRLRRLLLLLGVIDLLFLIVVAQQAGVLPRPTDAEEDALEASGIIQVTQISISSEFGGRVMTIPVSEGDRVRAGDLLVQLDTTLLDAQIETARAAVAWAEAGLAQARAGARSGQIAVAEAQLAQAQTARAAATQAVSDTMALVENPQDIRLKIAVAQAQAEAAQYEVARAITLKDAAEIAKNGFEDARAQLDAIGGPGRHKVLVRSGSIGDLVGGLPELGDGISLPGDGVFNFGDFELHVGDGGYALYKWINLDIPLDFHLTPNLWWQAWVGVNAATAEQEGLQSSLSHLYAQRANPQSLATQVDEALAALAQAEAQVAAAQAQVDGLKAGATPEQVVALEARVAQAEAALDSVLTQRAMMAITAPSDGLVVDVVRHPGEVAAPGAELLKVAELLEARLTVYLPETQIANVRLGQSVQVRVDSFPSRAFEGWVTYVSDRAEFTPRNISTQEERVNLVFAIEIHLPNPDGNLKPGMPADATFAE
jgi:multidrug resistance efflux pump